VKDHHALHLSYTPSEQCIRLISKEHAILPEKGVPSIEKKVNPLITQVRPAYFSVDCGMSYVIRVSDGRFVLIDGGVGEYEEADHLWDILMSQYEGKDKPDLKIKLEPISYGMKEVNVYGELLVYKKMLRDVVDHISENYIDKPYNYEGYFKYITTRNGVEKMKEAVVTIYDAKGYNREDPETVFKDVCYKYNQVRRSEQPESVLDGLTALDDILTADIVRNTRNVLDIVNARDYKLKSKGKLLYEGDSVQVISYTAVKPSISTTGDPAVKTYSGEIYVNLKDFAVLKNVTHITSKDFNRLGRNLVTVGEAPKSDVKITITTTYKKLRDTYFLSGVNMDYSYHEEGEEVMGKMEFVTTKVQMETPVAVEGRTYYEDIKENQDFWNQYSAYFEE
jgi:hypothetical protein